MIADVERILAEEGSSDEILRRVVARAAAVPGCTWAGIAFAEGGELVVGPAAGTRAQDATETAVPVDYEGLRVAELRVSPAADVALLERVAALIAPHCLVGWDTGGTDWDAVRNWDPPPRPPGVV